MQYRFLPANSENYFFFPLLSLPNLEQGVYGVYGVRS